MRSLHWREWPVAVALILWILGGSGLARAATPWQAPDYRQRITLQLPATAGGTLQCGVVLTGADFFRLTGFPEAPVRALLLGGPEGRLPLQVDERDGTGRPVTEGNGRLDDDDEMAFVTELGPTPRQLHLYYDGPEAPPVPARTTVTVQAGNPLGLTAGELSIAVRGGGLEDTGRDAIENHGRGNIVFCSWQGHTLLDQKRYFRQYFPSAFASSPGAPKWSEPVVVTSGPVRTVVEVHCHGYQEKAGEQVVLEGDVTHYVSVWNGAPVLDFEQVVTYTAFQEGFMWPYLGAPMVKAGRLIVPLLNQAYVIPIPSPEEHQQAPFQKPYSYNTPCPDEGWYALQDPAAKWGIATFHMTAAEIQERDSWMAYRPPWNPVIYVNTAPGHMEIRHRIVDRALWCRPEWRRSLRYVFLRDEQPEDVRLLYRCWGQPLDQVATVGKPQEAHG